MDSREAEYKTRIEVFSDAQYINRQQVVNEPEYRGGPFWIP